MGCFHPLATVNNAARGRDVQMSLREPALNSFDIDPEVGLLDHVVILFLIFEAPARPRVPISPHPHQHLLFSRFFVFLFFLFFFCIVAIPAGVSTSRCMKHTGFDIVMGTHKVTGKAGRETLRQSWGGGLPDPCRTCVRGGRAPPPPPQPGGRWVPSRTSPSVQAAGIGALSHSSAAQDQMLEAATENPTTQ